MSPEQAEKPRITIAVIEVSDQYCRDILVTCVEGGSPWAEFQNIARDETADIHSTDVQETEEPQEKPGWTSVTCDDIRRGIKIATSAECSLHGSYKQMILNDENDAISADAVLQCAVFGKIIYG